MIESGAVDLWTIRLDRDDLGPIADCLSADERARCERFRRAEDRRRYVAARAQMRSILGRYLGCDPAASRFVYGPQGKPELPGSGLHFNLAHSHERAVLAIAAEGPVGVDLEYLGRERNAEAIVGRFFTERERAIFADLPDALRQDAFYRGWTGKEAYLKAIGKGLAGLLEGVGVEIDPREPAGLVELADDDPTRWILREFRPSADYRAAAVTVVGLVATPRFFDNDDPA